MAPSAATRRLRSPNLTRLILTQATASSDLGWLYIDGRRSVIVRMLHSLEASTASESGDPGDSLLGRIAEASHDLEATDLTWTSECISISWDLGEVRKRFISL